MCLECLQDHCGATRLISLDWEKAWKSSLLEAFTAEVQTGLAPLLNNEHNDVDQLDWENEFLAVMPSWRDDILSSLCAYSRVAPSAWKEVGCSLEGPLH